VPKKTAKSVGANRGKSPRAAKASRKSQRRVIPLARPILDRNDRLAVAQRAFFRSRGILALNVVSSPGAGKTTLIRETLSRLQGRLKSAVVVGDLATENDAVRLRDSGSPAVQIITGTVCHLETNMVTKAMKQLDLDGLELLVIENVGNLVCPASFDLGEKLRVVLLSVTDGEDKPLKYPPMFHSANVVVISKLDLAQACECHIETAMANIRKINPAARVFGLSSKTGSGMDAWCDYLVQQHAALRNGE
jgi:hydrogenase nickel incorporation protein HypB